MDSQGNPLDHDIWGNSPADVWGHVNGTDVHLNEPRDVFGNYAGDAHVHDSGTTTGSNDWS
jgi:hypothetical protein